MSRLEEQEKVIKASVLSEEEKKVFIKFNKKWKKKNSYLFRSSGR